MEGDDSYAFFRRSPRALFTAEIVHMAAIGEKIVMAVTGVVCVCVCVWGGGGYSFVVNHVYLSRLR